MDFPIDTNAPGPADSLRGRRILVVDDDDDTRTFLTAVLEDAGASTIEAANGFEGVGLARSEQPDLITLDLSMPGKNGVETFAELKSTPAVAGIPVCIISGHTEFRDVVCANPECSPEGFLDKPIQAETLLRRLASILTRAGSELAARAARP